MAHREVADEHIELAVIRLVVEEQPARSVEGVEVLVWDVSGLGEHVGRGSLATLFGSHINVADLPRKKRLVARSLEADGDASKQAHHQASVPGSVDQPSRFLQRIGNRRGAVATRR
jgi:hypothetical protein